MKSTLAKIATAFIMGSVALGSVAPAYAQMSIQGSNEDSNNYRQREQYVQRYCDNNRRDRDCRDFRDNRRSWNDRRYQDWYRSHNRNNGGDAIGAGIFGLAIGAIVGGAINNSNRGNNMSSSHIQRCEARYRSYDRRSDTFLGNDGDRHSCNL